MPSKKIVLKTLGDGKYGSNHQGLFALEAISKDELLFEYISDEDPYYDNDDPRGKYTKEQLLKLVEDRPRLKDSLLRHTFYIGNGQYNLPVKFVNEDFSNVEECVKKFPWSSFLNHSCDPNIYFFRDDGFALRDISAGEELTVDYNRLEDENSWEYGIVCMCGSGDKCAKILRMDKYRDPVWVKNNERFCLRYIRQRISELRKTGELP